MPRDYTNELANNDTFIKALLGEDLSFGSGKTLKSGANDHVFVYFSDHGAKGIVAFGDNYLTAKTLNDVRDRPLMTSRIFYKPLPPFLYIKL